MELSEDWFVDPAHTGYGVICSSFFFVFDVLFYCDFVTFQCQVWCLIVSISDLYLLFYFHNVCNLEAILLKRLFSNKTVLRNGQYHTIL